MQESRNHRLERERQKIIYLHDKLGYSFKEISKMPEYDVTTTAVFKRYKKQKIKNKPKVEG